MIRFHAFSEPSVALTGPTALGEREGGQGSAKARKALADSAQNLVNHIPGEASGFYLLAVGALVHPPFWQYLVVFLLAFVLLVVVRWAAGASLSVMVTTIIAFIIWMFVLDQGLFNVALPGMIPGPLGFIIAVFYSTLITALANAGVLK